MPFFSVIIPTYNRAGLVAATLDSIFAQSFRDFEVIVIDDGSTDHTLEVLSAYGDRITVIRQKGAGPGAARNAGIAVARGEYVCFLDSDDLWFAWSLETYRRVIDEFHHPSYVTGASFVFSDERQTRSVAPTTLKVAAFADYFSSSRSWRWYSCSSFVVRRDALRKIGGFISEWVNAEDADLAMRLGLEPGFVNIESPHMFAYRSHATSAMANIDKTFEGLNRMLMLERGGAYPGGLPRRHERREILARALRPLTLDLLKRGDVARAWSVYRRMWGWNLRQLKVAYLAAFPFFSAAWAIRGRPRS